MEIILFKITFAIYLLSGCLFFARKRWVFLPILGLVFHITGVILYSLKAGRPPFASLYESILFFSLLIILFFLLFKLWEAGGYILLFASISLFYIVFSPSSPQPLMPALRSFWLPIHVALCFLSYTFFILSGALGLGFLIRKEEPLFKTILSFVKWGFILLTLGIITGSIWAYDAWGRYWGWDPKEVWALITWLYYSLFFHSRLMGGGKRLLSYLAIIGIFVILFTFLGVGFLFSGLHSYF
ncbi:MAG: cytochrome c biogenesis protein CcsA [bacterium]